MTPFLKGSTLAAICLLAACGSDSDSFISPLNDTQLDLIATDSPITIEQGISTEYYSNLSYGPDTRNVFDIFLPDSDTPTPLIIFVHGGGFFTGDKTTAYLDYDQTDGSTSINIESEASINDALEAGVAFATINYSLLDVPGFNAAETVDTVGISKSLSDVKEALQYIRYNANSFNIDPEQVAMYGVSAGAGSSLWIGLSDDMINIESENPQEQQSTRIKAIGAIETQGSYDLVRWEEILSGVNNQLSPDDGLLEDALLLGAETFIQAIYGLAETGTELLAVIRNETGELADYRKTLDFPALMDSGDPAIYVSNTWVDPFADNSADMINALLHFPTHAKAIKSSALNAGVTVTANIPKILEGDPTGQTVIPFLLERLQ